MSSGRRIAFYIDSLKLGGAERVLLQWAHWCREAGWAVVVLTRRGADLDAYPLPPGVERWVESADPAWLSRLGWGAFPWRVWRLRRRLQRGSVRLAVGVTTLPAVKLLLACRGTAIPCVVSERNYPPAKLPSLPWRWLRRLTYPWAALHLVQTDTTASWLRRHCGVRSQLLLPNPVVWPLPRGAPMLEPERWLPADAPVVLAAGTKAHQKGFDRLVRALPALLRHVPELRLVILGLPSNPYHGVDQQALLRGLLGEDPAQERLVMPGPVGNIADWYGRATVFALPSRYEGFPNVLLEAMAAGCACVASDCPTGPAELIRPGVDGVLLGVDADAQDWADAMVRLLRDPDERRRLGSRAREVRRRFDASALRLRFLGRMEELLADG
ncbi:glycosyltransferase [Synechococcus sp. CCY 9618]|uniref:glycosyltransferase n=1 Tax=Synechococcus sp. CCY 9618 TaxID=2815602 RepID=UPI001C24E573|nr:glycosyltransferase [Synechococcus sp. CCY 9618]